LTTETECKPMYHYIFQQMTTEPNANQCIIRCKVRVAKVEGKKKWILCVTDLIYVKYGNTKNGWKYHYIFEQNLTTETECKPIQTNVSLHIRAKFDYRNRMQTNTNQCIITYSSKWLPNQIQTKLCIIRCKVQMNWIDTYVLPRSKVKKSIYVWQI